MNETSGPAWTGRFRDMCPSTARTKRATARDSRPESFRANRSVARSAGTWIKRVVHILVLNLGGYRKQKIATMS
jgi:hypothetical protein